MVESLLQILTVNQKKKSDIFRDKSYRRQHFFNKQVEYCESDW